jgi:hypothetical protein
MNIECWQLTEARMVPVYSFVFEDTLNPGDVVLSSVEFELVVSELDFDFLFLGREFGFDFTIKN